jgi:hypothetical protein
VFWGLVWLYNTSVNKVVALGLMVSICRTISIGHVRSVMGALWLAVDSKQN